MKHKLGQYLIQAGFISPQQLDQLLDAQIIFGGRLGTNAVELEYISIDQLSYALSQMHGVPEISQDILLKVSDEALQLIPCEIANQYKIFPIRIEGKVLHLAMIEPQNLQLLDSLTFQLGVRIQPYVVPELRLYYHLEIRYGIKQEKRFLRVRGNEPTSQEPTRRQLKPTLTSLNTKSQEVPVQPRPRRDSVPEYNPFQNKNQEDDEDSFDLVYLDDVGKEAQEPEEEDDFEVTVVDPPWGGAESINTSFDIDAEDEFQGIFDSLENVENRDQIMDILVERPDINVSLSVLFLLRGEMAIATRSSELEDNEVLRKLVIALDTSPLLKEAADKKEVIFDSARKDPTQYNIANVLTAPMPEYIYVVPIVLAGRVVNILVLQTDEDEPIEDPFLDNLKKLTTLAADGYLRLIKKLKNG